MLEFKQLFKEYEELSVLQRSSILTYKSVDILAKLKKLDIEGIDPVNTLASFIIGAVVADNRVNEQEYLLIYPSLVKTFGDNFDFDSIKESFKKDYKGNSMIKKYSKELIEILSDVDESLQLDIIILCLCVVSLDGKISLKERRYIKQLCKI